MTDDVCVLDASLSQVFENARAIKATVRETSKAMEHPLEDGTTATDHRILEPAEVELSLVIAGEDYRATFQQVREYFRRGELLTVQTRVASYPSMMITGMPHEESPDAVDSVTLALTLKEVTLIAAQFSDLKVARPADSKTVQRGEQQPQEPKKKQSSVLSGIFR